MKSGHLSWAKREQVSKEILLQDLFDDYWTSKAHEFSVRGQSVPLPTSPLIAHREAQGILSLGNIASLWN